MVNRSAARLDSTFAALADPTRRAFLDRLSRESSTPGALAEPHAISLPAVSRHLRVLERAGLIVRRRRGRRHELRLVPRPLEQAAAWIAQHRAFWERQLESLERYLDQTTAEEVSPWRSRAQVPRSRSRSEKRFVTRAKKSSGPGSTPRR